MTTNYDPIAGQYKQSKQQPIESSSLLELVGDAKDLRLSACRRRSS
jgi:hypothetical protein